MTGGMKDERMSDKTNETEGMIKKDRRKKKKRRMKRMIKKRKEEEGWM